jgi:CheY-like chemotaxis protein
MSRPFRPIAPEGPVLLVDDEASVRRAAGRLLERFGYSVLLAADGNEAIACLEKESVWVMISDMVMPRMDGRDLIAVVRRRWPVLPVVLSTGYDAGRAGGGALELFDALLPKPYSPREMLEAIARAAARTRRDTTPPEA